MTIPPDFPAAVVRVIAGAIALAIGLGSPAPPPPVEVPVVHTAAERDHSGGERVRRIPAPERRVGGGTTARSGTVDRMQDTNGTGTRGEAGTGGTAERSSGGPDRRGTGGDTTGSRGGSSGSSGSSGTAGSGSGNSGTGGTRSGNAGSPGSSTSAGRSTTGAGSGEGVTAAATHGWGTPERSDDFTGGLGSWGIYDGDGHGGNGRRTPDAVSTSGGVLTLTGDSAGNTAGMAWNPGRKYGRWEARVRAPASDPSYHALLLLWPDAENWPVGGEVDFMEMMDDSRRTTNMFLHYGADNSQLSGDVDIDGTQWHNWAVEWTPTGITAFVDGEEWFHTSDTSVLPPGPMHLCIQLDWFPSGGGVRESRMEVDWVRQYDV
ncbi:hypothetical protein GCM10009836_57520 [Pseudonocardia ailaonensis]|uniref:GH16 domain-containing protein n=1 Tax=Pseudonocardia ailaonensis TaxID=367279 RepID=A0ABN2NII4_9PSEU